MMKMKQENGETKAVSGTGPFGKSVQYAKAPSPSAGITSHSKAVPAKTVHTK